MYDKDVFPELETIIFDDLPMTVDEVSNIWKKEDNMIIFTFPASYYAHSYIIPLNKLLEVIIIKESYFKKDKKDNLISEAEKIIKKV